MRESEEERNQSAEGSRCRSNSLSILLCGLVLSFHLALLTSFATSLLPRTAVTQRSAESCQSRHVPEPHLCL